MTLFDQERKVLNFERNWAYSSIFRQKSLQITHENMSNDQNNIVKIYGNIMLERDIKRVFYCIDWEQRRELTNGDNILVDEYIHSILEEFDHLGENDLEFPD